jgi:recombination protein RecA
MTDEDRQRAIRLKLARMQSGPEIPGPHAPASAIPTGSGALDAALGIGGLPRGGIVELFGPAGSGKTSLALAIVAHWQKAGGSAAWIDAERSFDPAYAARLGVAIEQLPVAQPESAEQAFAMMRQLALAGAVELLVVDSAAALVPALELETPLGESGLGLQSRVLGSGLRKLARAMARAGATTVFLNQTRSRPIHAGGADQEEFSAGGPALKLYASLRIALELAGAAGRTRFRVLKNKAGEPFREGELRWNRAAPSAESPSESP